ncbi:MAG: hypothetical protein ACYTX0_37455 [Nostoc sp.]
MTKSKNRHISSTFEQLKFSSEVCAKEVQNLLSYVQTVDPELKRHEAMMVAAALFNQLPDAFILNPEMLINLKATCQVVKDRRK